MALLDAREERAWIQRKFLDAAAPPQCVVQISLNVPGLPKRINGDSAATAEARGIFLSALGAAPSFEVSLSNCAGIAHLIVFSVIDARRVKKAAMLVEEGSEAGRALDIDVITSQGQISRSDLGMAARKCVICGEDAKTCTRLRNHTVCETRDVMRRLLSRFQWARRDSG
jgi:holo-ACP synthase CitX